MNKEFHNLRNLPIYDIIISEEDNLIVDRISIVGNPAVESNFLKFNANKRKLNFSVSSEDKMELLGVALIPDTPIYRNIDGVEYYVTFSKETIKDIVQIFFKNSFHTNMNVDHLDIDAKSFIYQSMIIDRELGIMPPKGIEDAPDGSWVVGAKVTDINLWNDIKSGKQNGFSVEGLFGMIDRSGLIAPPSDEDVLEAIRELTEELSKHLK